MGQTEDILPKDGIKEEGQLATEADVLGESVESDLAYGTSTIRAWKNLDFPKATGPTIIVGFPA